MPACNVNCCLCGAPVDETPPWPEWMRRFRGVCTLDEQWTFAFVSGFGVRRRFNDAVPNPVRNDAQGNPGSEDVLTPSIEQAESIDKGMMEIDIVSSQFGDHVAVGPGQRIWGFPFHSPCWELLNARCETQEAAHHEPQVLFDVLRSFPRHTLIEFGHDYGGVAGYDIEVDLFNVADPSHQPCHLLPGEEHRMVYDRTDRALLEMQKHNPMRVDEICSVFKGEMPAGRPVSTARAVEIRHNEATKYSDPFEVLPVELLQSITIELSSAEVVALKRSSRVFQRLPLPDTFWRSRFLPGREFEYVLEAFKYFETLNGQWKTIYQNLRIMSKSPGVVNRRRIWDLTRTLDNLLETRFENTVCSGTKVRSYFESEAAEEKDVVWIEGHRCLRNFNEAFSTGCRELYARRMLVPPNATIIYVSVVDILGKTYVSGLRFQESRGAIQQMGYIRPSNEVPLLWSAQSEPRRVTGFHLALDQCGIRGLCIVSGERELSVWAGQHHDIPKRRLVLPTGNQDGITKLRGGFDALKLVSLSLSIHECTSPRLSVPTTPSLRDTALWFPEIPESHLSFSGITTKNLRIDDSGNHQRPLSMLIFGASNASHLNHIECLTVLTQEDHGVMGLGVTFESPVEGKVSMFLGSDKSCVPLNRCFPPESLLEYKMSFDISAGEELIAMDVLQDHYVLGLKLYTNLGRVVEFPSPEDSEWDMDTRAWDEGELISVKPDSGKIVGFLARAGSKGLQNLGLVHMELPETVPVKD